MVIRVAVPPTDALDNVTFNGRTPQMAQKRFGARSAASCASTFLPSTGRPRDLRRPR
jgi:hypothetical protein